MKIEQIKISNFRIYKDETIDFDPDKINVFVAKTGSGKSCLLNAISWCLYGEAGLDTSKSAGKEFPLINVEPKTMGRFDKTAECKVEMLCSTANGYTKIIRSQSFTQTNVGWEVFGSEKFKVLHSKNDRDGYRENKKPEDWIELNFPIKIKPYCILNTERIEQFKHTPDQVKSAILQIAQLDNLSSVIKRLEKIKDGYVAEAKNNLPKENSTDKEDYDKYKKAIEEVQARRNALVEENVKISDILTKNREAILTADASRKAGDKVKAAERKLANAQEALQREQKEEFSTFLKSAMHIFASEAELGFSKELDTLWTTDKIPGKVTPQFLKELLDSNLCVCGCDLSEGSEHRRFIEARIEEQNKIAANGKELADIRRDGDGALRILRSSSERFRTAAKNIAAADDAYREARREETEAAREFAEIGEANFEIASVLRDSEELQARLGKNQKEIGELNSREKTYMSIFKRVESRIVSTSNKLKKNESLNEKIKFIKLCSHVAEESYKELVSDCRSMVSDALNEAFLETVWKKDTFKCARLDDRYNIIVENYSGQNAVSALSGGEDVSLALSFSQALDRVSDFSVPLVLDSPLVKLDDEVKTLVASSISKNTGDRQVILLMKPDECNPDVLGALLSSSQVLRREIVHYEEKHCSKVVE